MNADDYQNRVKHSSIKLPAYRLKRVGKKKRTGVIKQPL